MTPPEQIIRCPQCGRDNPADAQFCMRCGTALTRACPSCGATNPLGAHFCLECGSPLAGTGLAERRVVSVLFADLVGSTSLTTSLDPEPMHAIIGRYFAAMREVIERHGGTVEKFIGDAVMAVFGLPVAHEDDPERAVRAALAMQERMTELNARRDTELRMRIGIATGEVVADPQAAAAGQFMVTGEVVNFASRLQTHAPAGGVVVDQRTYEGSRHTTLYHPLPAVEGGEFAGRPRWQLTGVGERRSAKRLQAGLVGRDEEIQFLMALYRRAVEGRRPNLVTIVGPAGVGKTRLVDELLDSLASGTNPPHVLRGRCPAYGEGLTYWPLAEMLKQECDVKDNDPAAVAAQKLRAGVLRICGPLLGTEDSDMIAADLATILGVELAPDFDALWRTRLQTSKQLVESRPVAVRDPSVGSETRHSSEVVLQSLRAFFFAKAHTEPLVLVFEDLHWAEQSLLDTLERLGTRGTDAPVLMVCLARPELLERYPGWGMRIRDHTTISLAPLPAAMGDRLITELLKGAALPADVHDAVLARAEGNPFFIEEILRILIDEGSLAKDDGGWRWAAPSLEIRIPDTIHGLLLSRLDLLSPLEKRVIQDASVVGRIFWPGALLAMDTVSPAEAAAALTRLADRDLVEERPVSSLAGEREFAFTHALIREVAYMTLPKTARSDHHLRFARWLGQAAPENSDEFLEVVAYHREQAWRHKFETGDRDTALARSSVDALRRAGARATTLGTLPEARRLYERALTVVHHAGLETDAGLYAELLTDHSDVVKWVRTPATVFEDTETVLRLAPAIGREDLLARAWLNRAFAEYDRENLESAEKALHKALELFRKLADRQGEAEAFELLGIITHSLRGRLSKAQTAYEKALELYRAMGDGKGTARTLAFLGRALLDSGQVPAARPVLEEAYALANNHHERVSQAAAATGLAIFEHLAGESEASVRYFTEAITVRRGLGDPVAEAYTRRHLGMHLLRQGKVPEAEREIQTARSLLREHGATTDSPFLLRSLAEISLARGDLIAAAEYAEQSLAGVLDEDAVPQATHRATLAKVRAAQGRAEEAGSLFEESVQILGEDRQEYRFDYALTLLKYGEGLLLLGHPWRAKEKLEQARALFAQMGASNFVREIDTKPVPSPALSPHRGEGQE